MVALLLALLAVGIFPAMGTGQPRLGHHPDRVAAAIDQRVITERDLDFWCLEARLQDPFLWEVPNEELRPQLLPLAVNEILLADWAEVELEELPRPLVRDRARDWRRRLEEMAGGAERLEDMLTDSALEPEELVIWIEERSRRKLLIEQAIGRRLPVGSEDAMEGRPADAAALRIAHLVVRIRTTREEAWERALTIRREIAFGLPFSHAVRLYSDDPHSRQDGGELGWLEHDALAKPLWDAATGLRRGDVTQPVYWRGAFHLLRLIDYETERQRRFFESLREEEHRQLRQQRQTRRIRLAEGYTLPPPPGAADEEERNGDGRE